MTCLSSSSVTSSAKRDNTILRRALPTKIVTKCQLLKDRHEILRLFEQRSRAALRAGFLGVGCFGHTGSLATPATAHIYELDGDSDKTAPAAETRPPLATPRDRTSCIGIDARELRNFGELSFP